MARARRAHGRGSSPAAMLARLERLKSRFGDGSADEKRRLVSGLARRRLTSAAQVTRLHEALCFLRAYPDDAPLLAAVESALAGFERRTDLRRFSEDLADSGIAGTPIHYHFYQSMAAWLVEHWGERLHIDWEHVDEDDPRVARLLPLVAHFAETLGLDESSDTTRGWLERMAGKAGSDAALLVRGLQDAIADGHVREHVHDGLDLPMRLEPGPGGPSRTLTKFDVPSVHWQTGPLAGGRPKMPDAVRQRPRSVRNATLAEGRRLHDLCRESMVTRDRDLDAFAYGDPRDVRLVDWGGGQQFAVLGVRPERRLLLEAVYAFLTLENGVPLGYVLISALNKSSEIAFNVFETFRGGEAGLIYGRVMATTRHLFGSDTFTIYPYQLGHENEEAIASGAWWFYQKLGFRPRDRGVLRLMNAELAKIARRPRHRSSAATLRRLAEVNVYYEMGRRREDVISVQPTGGIGLKVTDMLARRFGDDRARATRTCDKEAAALLGLHSRRGWSAGERLAFRRWAPLVLLLGAERWSAAERRALLAVVRAKGGRRESDFVRLYDGHARLRRAVQRLAKGG